MVDQILVYGRHAFVGGSLVQLVAEGGAEEAVQPQELGIVRERAGGEVPDEIVEVGLRRVVVLGPVVAQAPVVLHCIVTLRAVGEVRQRFEELGGLGILALVEIVERRLVLCVRVVALQERFVRALAGKRCGCKQQCGYDACFLHCMRNFSASSAARQPDAAAVMAWR